MYKKDYFIHKKLKIKKHKKQYIIFYAFLEIIKKLSYRNHLFLSFKKIISQIIIKIINKINIITIVISHHRLA
jgi:hypothetical protein